jgi:hypothetical protein
MKPDSKLNNWIEETIREYTSEASDKPEYLKYYAKIYDLLPIYNTWTHAYGLRSDGTLFLFSTDAEEMTIEEERDERLKNLALYQGAKKYPAISSLVPHRPTDAIDCSGCGGQGKIEIAGMDPDVIVCYCGGLGWLPKGTIIPGLTGAPEGKPQRHKEHKEFYLFFVLFVSLWFIKIWSGRRGSNPQPSGWEPDALPLRYTRSNLMA